ncbi:MAG: WYL domain-containing protein [Actinomycetales bacterium]|nr:WYL domain-containing protein [Actinomycetales bacterium]
MGKNFSAPLERTARLLDLVPYIHAHQGIALKDLAAVFEVSNAQMVNDLTTLWMCGLPGYTPLELMDLDFESGYVSISNAPTLAKPRSVTFDEGVALILGLDLLRASIPVDRIDLLEKIDFLSARISTIINLSSTFSVIAPINQGVSAAIDQALSSRCTLEIEYHSVYRDEVTERVVFPIEIVEIDGQQYLSSYCYSASDFRQFKLDRIQSAVVTHEIKTIPKDSSKTEKINSRLKVLKPNRQIAERFSKSDLKAGSEFVFQTYSQQWLERSILSSGDGVVLITPPEIRASIAQMAQSMLDRYKDE